MYFSCQDELSYAILELQKDRFFEELKAKYWNSSNQQSCPLSEEQEGITLESLGGVFIATLFGLIVAMITLAVEVIYYQKKQKKLALVTQVKPLEEEPSSKIAWVDTNDSKDIMKDNVVHPKDGPIKKLIKRKGLPPSFEAATFGGKKPTITTITLGDGQFKPRLRDPLHSRHEPRTGYLE